MLELRRFCIGAALGLSLLACGPAFAVPLPLKNPGFNKVGGVVTGWNATRTKANVNTGYASWSANAEAIVISDHLTTPLKTTVTYTLSGSYLFKGKHSATFVASISGGGGHRILTYKASTNSAGVYKSFLVTLKPSFNATRFRFSASVYKTTSFATGPGALVVKNLNAVPVAAPEVDPQDGAPALALALGGLALMSERRKRYRAQP